MSRFDSRSSDSGSYRECKRDSGLGGGGYEGNGKSWSSSSSKKEGSPKKIDLDGLTHFEKNFYVESPSVASMTESDIEEYRLRRQITVDC